MSDLLLQTSDFRIRRIETYWERKNEQTKVSAYHGCLFELFKFGISREVNFEKTSWKAAVLTKSFRHFMLSHSWPDHIFKLRRFRKSLA